MENEDKRENEFFPEIPKRDPFKTFDKYGTYKLIRVEGTVKFDENPKPGERIFRFSVNTNLGTKTVQIDREEYYGRVVLCDNCYYVFECTMENDIYDAKIVTQVAKDSFEEDNTFQRGFLMHEKVKLSAISEKMLAIKLNITGTVEDVVEVDNKIAGFNFKYNDVVYTAIQREKLFRSIYTARAEKGMILALDGVFVGDRLYVLSYRDVTDIYFLEEEMGKENYAKFSGKILCMGEEKKNEILDIFKKCKKNTILEENPTSAFTDIEGLKDKYEICKQYYPPEIQQAIERTINDRDMRRDRKTNILDILVNTCWSEVEELNMDFEDIKAKLDKTHYGQEYLKRFIIKLFYAYIHRTEKKGCAVLVCGAPGIGKTSFFRSACDAFGKPFAKISLNGVDTPFFLKGTPRLYDNAVCGQIVSVIRQVGDHSVILLDEVDKMSTTGREGNPYGALCDLLDPSEKFQDSFIEEDIDLGNVIFVLTANDISKVPPAILDRVTVIHISDYTEEEKCIIAKDYIIPKEMSRYDLDGKNIVWADEVIDDIANKYTLTNGVRDIEKNVRSIVNTSLVKMDQEGTEEIVIDKTNIEEVIDVVPCRRDKVEYDISGLKNKFRYFKYEYSKVVREKVITMLRKYEESDDKEKEVIRKRLAAILNILPAENKEMYNLSDVQNKLDMTHDGMDDVKEQILMSIAGISATKKNTARCLLLDGPYGVGKTTIAESIAEAMHRKFIKISMNGVKNPQYIKGFETAYKDSECGIIFKNLAECGTDNVLILLDEIDKMIVSADSDPFSALIDLLDDSGMFTDNFCGVPVNMSNVFFIATSNNIANIPGCVLDRMEIIELTGYTKSEKSRITKEHIIPKKLKKYGVEDEFVIDDETADYITAQYCKAYGLRDVDKAVDKIICKALKERELGETPEINIEMVKNTLGAKPIKRGNVPSEERMRPGIARALAVSGNAGMTFAVQVTENSFGDSDEITGLPKQSTLDSIKIAKLNVSKILGKELPHIHIHFAEGGIEKDGPSAGIAIFSAIYSYFTNATIDRKVAFTGEIDIYGDVWAIGGTDLKITAAINEGYNKVFIPHDNYIQLEEEGKLSKYNCEIIAISNVEELIERLFVINNKC